MPSVQVILWPITDVCITRLHNFDLFWFAHREAEVRVAEGLSSSHFIFRVWLAIRTWPFGEFPIRPKAGTERTLCKGQRRKRRAWREQRCDKTPHYSCQRPLAPLFLFNAEYILALHSYGLSVEPAELQKCCLLLILGWFVPLRML